MERMSNRQLTVILGKHAAAWHMSCRREPLAVLAAQWRESLPSWIVLPHPSPRNRNWLTRHPWFEADTLPVLRRRIAEVLATSHNP